MVLPITLARESDVSSEILAFHAVTSKSLLMAKIGALSTRQGARGKRTVSADTREAVGCIVVGWTPCCG